MFLRVAFRPVGRMTYLLGWLVCSKDGIRNYNADYTAYLEHTMALGEQFLCESRRQMFQEVFGVDKGELPIVEG